MFEFVLRIVLFSPIGTSDAHSCNFFCRSVNSFITPESTKIFFWSPVSHKQSMLGVFSDMKPLQHKQLWAPWQEFLPTTVLGARARHEALSQHEESPTCMCVFCSLQASTPLHEYVPTMLLSRNPKQARSPSQLAFPTLK